MSKLFHVFFIAMSVGSQTCQPMYTLYEIPTPIQAVEQQMQPQARMMVSDEFVVEEQEDIVLTPNFNSNDIRGSAEVTIEQLEQVVPNSMVDIIDDIVELSEQYDINSIAVTSIIRHESGNNTSWLAVNKNNLGGIKFNSNYASFETKFDCIEYMVKLLKEKYLSEDGKFFNGYSLKSVNKLYCPGDGYYWSTQITDMSNKMLKDIQNLEE